jgi:predicted nucleic acid-binding protein
VLRDKFQWIPEALRQAEEDIRSYTQRITPTETLDVVKSDPPDNRILECAATAKSDFVVSGDGHLLRLRHHGNARIVKVAEFLELVRRESPGPAPRH